MRRKNMKKTAALFLLSVGVNCMTAQDIVPVHEFDIDVQKVGSPIQSTMYGIFFEDINFGADGGLYAELIKNRSFEFPQPFVGWVPFGNVTVQDAEPCFDRNPHYVRIVNDGRRPPLRTPDLCRANHRNRSGERRLQRYRYKG